MRERTSLPRAVIESLPRLKMIASIGTRNRSVDIRSTPTPPASVELS
jgi:hypothetical protein